jgi:hypothetical protein
VNTSNTLELKKLDQIIESLKTPVNFEPDVVVVGGGVAGIAASIACARNGVSTLMVERYGFPGGIATAGLMNSINGFRNQRPPNHVQTVKGIAAEMVHELYRLGGCWLSTHYPQDQFNMARGELPYAIGFDPELFKYLTLKLLAQAKVDLLFHTYAVRSIVDDNRITGVIVENKGGRMAIRSPIIVDASGDGDIAFSAGAPYMQAPADAPSTLGASLMLRLANMPPSWDRGVPAGGNSVVVWGPRVRVDGTNPKALSQTEVQLRLQAIEFVNDLKSQTGFERIHLLETAMHLGVRETRRVKGEYILTKEDAENDVRFEDVIAISSNPVPRYYGERYFYNHLGFDIPYRCLVPQHVDGLLLAGRNISMEQAPWQSARSQAPNMAVSQAAGTAASLCVKQGITPRHLNVTSLQRVLQRQDAVLQR